VWKKFLALRGEISVTSKIFANSQLKNLIIISRKATKGYHWLFYPFANPVAFNITFKQQQKMTAVQDSWTQY